MTTNHIRGLYRQPKARSNSERILRMAAVSTATATATPAPAPKSTRETTDEIIKRIDVVAAYKEAGVTFTADKPRSTGFIECFAFGRDDARPSGYVNTLTGIYGDSTTGEKVTFWDFMSAHHPGVPAPGFFSTLKYFAQRAGIEIDTKDSHRRKNSYDNPAEVFEWLPDGQSHSFLWTFAFRRSTTIEALKFSGCQIARWRCFNKKSKDSSGDTSKVERVIGREIVCTVPFFNPSNTEVPTAYQCWNVTGQPLPLYAGKNKPPELLKIVSAGPIRGTLANAAAIKWLAEAQAIAASTNTTPPAAARVWKTCGPGDMLALLSIIPDALLTHPTAPHLVTTNGNGESGDCTEEQAKLFTAQNIFIPADADPKGWGMIGAKKWGNALALYTPKVKIFQLFEPTEENKAANRNDLRDWIRERKENPLLSNEEIYAELCELADKAEVYEAEAEQEREPAGTAKVNGTHVLDSAATPDSTTTPARKKITNQEEYYLGGKSYKRTVKPQQVLEDIYSQTGGWPRRLGQQLFWHNEKDDGKIVWITNTASLFSWLHDRCEGLDWHRGTELMNQDQFFQFVRNNATAYDSIEYHPQWPHVPNTFYACPMPEEPPPETTGNVIAELLSHFSFESKTDYALATCFVLTLFWGHCGTKPAFAITAKEGRGAGKTTFVDELSALVGGYMDINAQSSSEVIMQRLLSDEGMAARICRIDNIKTNRFSWDALESVITAKFITGKKMWVGEAKRANNIVWVMTVNGPSFSTDMSQRSIEIHLKKPEHRAANFLPKLQSFIANNKSRIAGDAIAMLKRPKHEVPADLQIDGRWSFWFAEIVGRICDDQRRSDELYSKIQHITNVRQHGNDDEMQDAEEFSDYIRTELMKFGYRLTQNVHISNQILAEWYRDYSNTRGETRNIVKSLKRSIEQGQITILSENNSHKFARGFVYRDSPDNPAVTDYGLEGLFLEFKRLKKYPNTF